MGFTFLLCLLMLHFRGLFLQKAQKDKWSHFIFYRKERIGSSLKECKMDGYVTYWKVPPNLLCCMRSETFFWLNTFKSCIRPWYQQRNIVIIRMSLIPMWLYLKPVFWILQNILMQWIKSLDVNHQENIYW